MPDAAIAEIAAAEDRLVITNDMDFGEIVFAQRVALPGVLLLRMWEIPPEGALQRLQKEWPRIAEVIAGSFIVMSVDKLRIRPLE